MALYTYQVKVDLWWSEHVLYFEKKMFKVIAGLNYVMSERDRYINMSQCPAHQMSDVP
jgi:hypothetical protein